ncbi:MAG: rod shape-determining protein RodA [Parcubacteria group bacterium CG1_02_37_51]|uniref:Rod shape-determining protein RodA n=1 Tax=Candidatus Komeilibacteria bacterium CG_4_10_14_0_8_um_filter_37_78 TaxID=1974471 RepID=A0A2M7RGB9_9BACT|nr:MAG: rod shape-determining protein RodA [Parcubacteria group bacterium CG1_02_37_51]PIY95396.1 MAG: rod shape-determining protein RodA [Candidatus Komeilibacteria bacterium CG_4_10_14_0_8_um_filter_37_78]
MWTNISIWLKKLDWLLLLNIFFLILFSISALYSLNTQQSFSEVNLYLRQLLFVLVGFGLIFLLSFFDYHWLKNYYKIILLIIFILLLAVLFFAEPIRGMTGWLEFGGQTFQPSELAKIAIVVFLAKYFSEKDNGIDSWKHILVTGGVVLALTILVAKQPDFGSAAIIFMTWLVFLFFTKISRKYFIGVIVVILILSVFVWSFVLEDYQQARLSSFMQPEQDLLGQGYNVQQSIIAVGSGQILGRGLGLGPQSQLNFLPEQYSDFIFAVIAESLGLWGSLLLISLYLILFLRLLLMARNMGDAFGAWLVIGFVIYFSLQVVINIGMAIGLAPVTGITLPFVSYGGSSLLTSFLVIGIIQSIIIKRKEKLFS